MSNNGNHDLGAINQKFNIGLRSLVLTAATHQRHQEELQDMAAQALHLFKEADKELFLLRKAEINRIFTAGFKIAARKAALYR